MLALVVLALAPMVHSRAADISVSCDDQRTDLISFTLSGEILAGDSDVLGREIERCLAKYDPLKVRQAVVAAYDAHDKKGAARLERRVAALESRAYAYGAPPMTLYLDSAGGDFREAMKIGKFARDHRLATIVDLNGRECSGACILVFLGGVARKYSWDSRVFLAHPSGSPAKQPGDNAQPDDAAMRQETSEFIARMGISAHLADMMHEVPVNARTRLERDTAFQLRVTGVDEAYFADVKARYIELWGSDAREIIDAASVHQGVARACALQQRNASPAGGNDPPIPRLDYHRYFACLTADGPALRAWRRYLMAIWTIDALQASTGRHGLPAHRLFAEAAGDWGF